MICPACQQPLEKMEQYAKHIAHPPTPYSKYNEAICSCGVFRCILGADNNPTEIILLLKPSLMYLWQQRTPGWQIHSYSVTENTVYIYDDTLLLQGKDNLSLDQAWADLQKYGRLLAFM